MADLQRSATPGSNWTTKDLLAFNVRIVDTTPLTFFSRTASELPPPSVSPTVLNNLTIDIPHAIVNGNLTKTDRHFFQYLKRGEKAANGDSPVTDFAAFLLRLVGYDDDDDGDRVVLTNASIPFYMAGQQVDATPDACLMDDFDHHLLVVQNDKRGASCDDPEPRLIPAALAAHHQNTFRCTRVGLPVLPSILMPGILMVGTAPVFYLIPVSPQLVEALATGSYPKEETVVLRLVPPVPDRETYFSEGMRPLANRRVVLQCFEAFKSAMNAMQSRLAPQVEG